MKKFIKNQSVFQFKKRNFCSIDPNEIKTFSQVNDWWSDSSSMIPLQAYNFARVNYLRQFYEPKAKPFENLAILDVGCGGGLFSESLSRLGGNVTAIDATYESFKQAQQHQELDKQLNIKYLHSTAENLLETSNEKYDLIVSMEVIEHVQNPQFFLKTLSQLVKTDGNILISTINKNIFSYLTLIVGAEYLTRIVPLGTHHWEKFIEPQKLQEMAFKEGMQLKDSQGFMYNPFNNTMNRVDNMEVNYIMYFKKIEKS